MTDSEILNEMEVKEILLKQWIDEANRLSDENTRIKHTTKEAYETERTAIGQSVLRLSPLLQLFQPSDRGRSNAGFLLLDFPFLQLGQQ